MSIPSEADAAKIALVRPSLAALPRYARTLRAGWSPDNVRGAGTAAQHLARIETDAVAFVASLHDPEGRGPPITLPDGTSAPRLPGYARWIWDGDFCGSISLRWQAGTSALPAQVLGHIGYAVVPWKRGAGYATRALRLLLPEAAARGLAFVELTTTPDNVASQKVILSNGGAFVERFRKTPAHGGGEAFRFRIPLAPATTAREDFSAPVVETAFPSPTSA
jgi:predicted acetyltransferase